MNGEEEATAQGYRPWTAGLHTGDLGNYGRKTAYFRITGRAQGTLIIRGGEKHLSGAKVGRVFLFQPIPKLPMFKWSAFPDDRLGEIVVALDSPESPAKNVVPQEVRRLFAAAGSRHFKVPQTIRFVDSFSNDRHRQDPEISRFAKAEMASLKSLGLLIHKPSQTHHGLINPAKLTRMINPANSHGTAR